MSGIPEIILNRATEILSAQQQHALPLPHHSDDSGREMDILRELCEIDLTDKSWKTRALSLVKKSGLIRRGGDPRG